LGGTGSTFPPIIDKRLRFHQLLPPFVTHTILVSSNIFDKSTPVLVE